MFAKDGYGIIFGTFFTFLLSLAVWYVFPHPVSLAATMLLGALSVFNLFFFRDPERDIPKNELAVVSPADGRVMEIKTVYEPEFFQKEVQRISIFLSVFNVHVNRTPISGEVAYVMHRTGKFLAAFKEKASLENEQTSIGMVDNYGHRVLFKQIAGLIARRIVCHLREGEWRKAGDRMGLIRYGSRVDIFLTIDAKVLVKSGQTVRGGESVLATFPSEGDYESEEKRFVESPKTEIPG